MSKDIKPDDEDTISVPIPVEGPEPKAEEALPPELDKDAFDMAEVCSALDSVGRMLSILTAQFERLRKLVEGEEGSVTHAPPSDGTGLTPCCSRSVLDIPITERISFDGAGITCKGVTG